MPSAEIAVKIEELENRGSFRGIMIDDARGLGNSGGRSFVRVGDGEMRALAAVINQRGRLSVADFASEANRVLQLSDEGEQAKQAGRSQSEDRHTQDREVGMEGPGGRCPQGGKIS